MIALRIKILKKVLYTQSPDGESEEVLADEATPPPCHPGSAFTHVEPRGGPDPQEWGPDPKDPSDVTPVFYIHDDNEDDVTEQQV